MGRNQIQFRMRFIGSEFRHPVIAVRVEPFGRRFGDHLLQPVCRTVTRQIGCGTQFPLIVEPVTVGTADTGCQSFAACCDQGCLR